MHTLILGIDGLDYNLFQEALPTMPFFQKLTEEAAWGMMIPDIALSPQSWSTIFTGVSERKHRIASFHSPLSRVRVPTLWSILGNLGRATGVFNVPMTFPPAMINGYMVAGQPCPYHASEPEGIVRGNPPQQQGEDNTKARHEWAITEGARLAIEHDPWCTIIATTIADEFGHGHQCIWPRGRKYLLDKIYPRLDEDVALLVRVLQPTVLAIFSDHGWNSQEVSDTLYKPWYEGRRGDDGKPVSKENWAWHTKEGLAFFRAPHVAAGKLEPFSNRDFLPTMLDIWNIHTELQFDGKPVTQFCYTDEDAEAIDKRLEALGYLS